MRSSRFFVSSQLILLSFIFLLIVAAYSRYGFDITDEGFYINWVIDPWIYIHSFTFFGFVFEPFWKLVGGDLWAFRILSVVTVYASAFVTTYCLINRFLQLSGLENQISRISKFSISSALSLSSFAIFYHWLITPNYNVLVFLAVLLWSSVSVPVLLCNTSNRFLGVLLGISFHLSFLAKPTSAVFLIFLSLVLFLLLNGKDGFKFFLLSAVTFAFLMVLTALYIDGGIIPFFERLAAVVELSRAMEGGHSLSEILRIDKPRLSISELLFIPVFAALMILVKRLGSFFLQKPILLYGVPTLIGGAVIFSLIGQDTFYFYTSKHVSYLTLATMLSSMIFFFWLRKKERVERLNWREVTFLGILFFSPFICAFGTNNNYWDKASHMGLFWLILSACLVLRSLIPTATETTIVAIFSLFFIPSSIIMERYKSLPYRQPEPIRSYSEAVEVGDSEIFLPSAPLGYIESLRGTFRKSGFEKLEPILDFTGASPGAIFLLEGTPLGAAWILGGYPGSENLAVRLLSYLPCEDIKRAWLIVERNFPRAISTDILGQFGLSLKSNYEMVGEVVVPPRFGGRSESSVQTIYKPVVGSQGCGP